MSHLFQIPLVACMPRLSLCWLVKHLRRALFHKLFEMKNKQKLKQFIFHLLIHGDMPVISQSSLPCRRFIKSWSVAVTEMGVFVYLWGEKRWKKSGQCFSDVMGAYWCTNFLAAVHLWMQCVVLWSWWGIFHCVWQGDGDLALQHMQKLLRALHSFIHPSNTGRWSVCAVVMSASVRAFVCVRAGKFDFVPFFLF